jgi:cytochrome c biogenesis protein CcmG/thiol:disulfide interchange protein DsbE
LLGIATQDSLGKVKDYLARGNRPYTNLYDEGGRLAIEFGVYGVPETYLIDRSGNVVDKVVGPVNRIKLSQQIRQALSAAPPAVEKKG